jgi:hypothetical protein
MVIVCALLALFFYVLAAICVIIMKASGMIALSWLWVLAPFWGPGVVSFVLALIFKK